MKQNEVGFIAGKYTEINWALDASGKLTVSGKGRMPDYSCGYQPSAPWEGIKDRIHIIEISDGITEIGINAFRDCGNLKRVVLPYSLSRIHAYAFWGCTHLEDIDSSRANFKYIYDCGEYQEDASVVFELGSFHNVPWSIGRWGDFYSRDSCLYACFSDKQNLTIPEGIRILASFSLSHLDVKSVCLPDTLEVIKNFAFADSSIRGRLALPDSILSIEAYAFSDCSMPVISFPFSWKPEKMEWKRTTADMVRRQQIPEYRSKYSVILVNNKNLGKFRRMKVAENKPVCHRGGTITKVRDENYINVGESVYRRIRNGKIILCITYEYGKIISVKSFSWDSYCKLPEEYLMYPIRDQDGQLLPWSDSFTYQEKEDIICAFHDKDAEALKNAGLLRFRHPDTHEEWFWSDDKGNYGGPLELELLDMWLKGHPEIRVDSMEENIKHGKTRWFVDI